MVKKISGKEFAEVQGMDVALIDFSAGWCEPCKMLAPVLEDVSEEMMERVAFYNVDVDENPDLAQQFGITSIPALVILKKGDTAAMHVGFQPKGGIISFIEAQLN